METIGNQSTDMFFARMKYKTCTGEFDSLSNLRIDTVRFLFPKSMEPDVQYNFFAYLETINLSNAFGVMRAAAWLRYHQVPYKLRFAWNRDESTAHNLKRIRTPAMIKKNLCIIEKLHGREGLAAKL